MRAARSCSWSMCLIIKCTVHSPTYEYVHHHIIVVLHRFANGIPNAKARTASTIQMLWAYNQMFCRHFKSVRQRQKVRDENMSICHIPLLYNLNINILQFLYRQILLASLCLAYLSGESIWKGHNIWGGWVSSIHMLALKTVSIYASMSVLCWRFSHPRSWFFIILHRTCFP